MILSYTVLRKIKSPVILAGHSVGGFLLLRYLVEKKIDQEVKGIFFMAIPFVGDGGWQFEGALKNNFASELPKVPLFFYQSDNDEVVPPEHLDLYAEKENVFFGRTAQEKLFMTTLSKPHKTFDISLQKSNQLQIKTN